MMGIIGAIAHVTQWMLIGIALIVAAGVVGYFFPSARRIAIELAVVFMLGTFLYGKGAHDQQQVCDARDKLAAEQAQERDEKQGKHADEDEKKDEGELERLRVELKKRDDAYETLVKSRKAAACTITPADVPRRK